MDSLNTKIDKEVQGLQTTQDKRWTHKSILMNRKGGLVFLAVGCQVSAERVRGTWLEWRTAWCSKSAEQQRKLQNTYSLINVKLSRCKRADVIKLRIIRECVGMNSSALQGCRRSLVVEHLPSLVSDLWVQSLALKKRRKQETTIFFAKYSTSVMGKETLRTWNIAEKIHKKYQFLSCQI